MPNDTALRAGALIARIQTHYQLATVRRCRCIRLENEELFPMFEPGAPARAA